MNMIKVFCAGGLAGVALTVGFSFGIKQWKKHQELQRLEAYTQMDFAASTKNGVGRLPGRQAAQSCLPNRPAGLLGQARDAIQRRIER